MQVSKIKKRCSQNYISLVDNARLKSKKPCSQNYISLVGNANLKNKKTLFPKLHQFGRQCKFEK